MVNFLNTNAEVIFRIDILYVLEIIFYINIQYVEFCNIK